MKHEVKKISRIVDELITFFLSKDTNHVDFSIKKDDQKTIIEIVDYGTHFTEEFIGQLRNTLNIQRQKEVEEYYWRLAGQSDCDQEMTLVGTMVDEAKIELIDGNLCLKIIRYNEKS